MGQKSGPGDCESDCLNIPLFSQLRSGTVYRGTWNRTDVAIKVLQNVAGVTPSLVVSVGQAHYGVGLTGCLMCSSYGKKLMLVPNSNCMSGRTDLVSQIWLTLRHPNVLQFLGANTLDNTPFLVMPYIRTNARQFLQERPGYDPVYIVSVTFNHSKIIPS